MFGGTLLGDAPDIDILFYFFKKKTLGPGDLSAHRKYPTHAPVVWFILGVAIFCVSPLLAGVAGSVAFWKIAGLLVWLCPWSHLLCDSIDYGVMWLWPFSERQFALYNSQEDLVARHVEAPRSWRRLFAGYFKSPVAYLELGITALALWLAILSL